VQLNGAVVAEAGYIDITRRDAPTLSSDVVVRRASAGQEAKPEPRIPFEFNLGIDLGSTFIVRGDGLDTRVEGALLLKHEGRGVVRASGALEARDGVYEGFGQKLAIERGRLTFQGAVENPALDILALRKNLPVEVGVTITRTAANPLVRLYSDPAMADFETLSWLVLGRPADESRGDNTALARAALGLLGGSGEGIPTQLARRLGIDELSIRAAESGGSTSLLPRQSVAGRVRGEVATVGGEIVSIGKRLSDNLTLSYETATGGAGNVVQLSYQLTRRVSVIARAGTESALDLVYSFAFD
jgi:translocation and assembly module TamB